MLGGVLCPRRFTSCIAFFGTVALAAWPGFAVEEPSEALEEKLEQLASEAEKSDVYLMLQAAETEEEERKALEILEPRAFDGELGAILVVAGHYASQGEGEDAKRKAFELYRLGAEQGDDICRLMVGLYYEQGLGVEKDLEKAESWYREAIEAGSQAALESLGLLLIETGERGEALSLLEKASDGGQVNASLFLADAAFFGDYGSADNKRALKFYRRAAEAKNGYGARKLGDFYRKGLGGLEVDLDAAYRWYSLARDYGDTSAFERLGSMHLLGEHGETDPDKALTLFEEGAEQLDQACMGWLAYLYSSQDWPTYHAEKGYFWSYVVGEIGLEQAEAFMERTAADLSKERMAELREEAKAIVERLE